MIRLKDTIILALVLFLASGCFDDKGNYDYSEINQVKIGGFPEEKVYAYRNVDTLRLSPEITGTLTADDTTCFDFRWEAVLKGTATDRKTRFPLDSNRLELEYFVELPENEYTVYLHVTDRNTKVSWRQGFDLKVTSATYEGWLILSEEEGMCRLDMVATSTKEEKIVRDLWKNSPLGQRKGPRALAYLPDYSGGFVYLLSDEGTTQLDPMDFSYDPMYELRYEFGDWDNSFVPDAMYGNMPENSRIVVGRNGIYTMSGYMMGRVYGLNLNRIDGEGKPFELAPVIGVDGMSSWSIYGATYLFYDITNKRFVQLTGELKRMMVPVAEEKYFSWNTGKDFVYMAGGMHDGGSVFAILKDEKGKPWFHGMKTVMSYTGALEQVKGLYFEMDPPEFAQATAYAIHPLAYKLFYAVGNRIYQYDINSHESRLLRIRMEDGSVVDRLDGEEISMLKFNMFAMGVYSKPQGSDKMQYRLIVGSRETGGTGDLDGHVRMLEVDVNDVEPASVFRSYDGFGEIVDVVYRERM